MAQSESGIATLLRLSDSNRTVADPDDDGRGGKVVERNGEEPGTVDDLMIDDRDLKVRFLRVASGGFLGMGETHFMLPVDQACARWRQAGRGIWEVRGSPRLFLYSRLLCWVALDRGLKLAERYALGAPLDRWRQTREVIRRAILSRGYDAEQGGFTQAFGRPELDASALVIPRLGFLPPTDPRVQSTIERIRAELTGNGLVYRYLAEEIDPTSGELLGNFPQGFSHLALIGSAVNLAKAGKHGAEHEPQDEGERIHPARRAAAEGYA